MSEHPLLPLTEARLVPLSPEEHATCAPAGESDHSAGRATRLPARQMSSAELMPPIQVGLDIRLGTIDSALITVPVCFAGKATLVIGPARTRQGRSGSADSHE